MSDGVKGAWAIALLVIVCLLIIGGLFLAWPKYKVYQQTQAGLADLKEAEYNRQIMVVQAEAQKQAAKDLAAAAIIRAGGIAEANKIIDQTLTSLYIQWLFVDGLNEGLNQNQIIYVPSAGLLPVFDYSQDLKAAEEAAQANRD